jgi:hypothetical protein
MAQAGGRDASKLDEALEQAPAEVEKQLMPRGRGHGKAPDNSAEH